VRLIPTESKTRAKPDVEWVPLGQLDPAPYNPRKIRPGPFAKLKRSIEKFGQADPIIANRVNNRIVGGHMRYAAYTERGEKEALVRWVDIEDEQEEKALNVALNNSELAGEWDNDKLGQLLAGMAKDKAILTGFDQSQIDGFIARANKQVETPTYPLAAKMLEHYDYAVIFVTNDTDWLNLQAMLALETESSYKKQKIGTGRVVPFERFVELWESRGERAPKAKPKEA
jgi:hypothetical protein